MEKKWGSENTILPGLMNLGASGVDLFFIISGFVMVIVTRGMFQQKGTVATFMYNRISRIYPLYWFYSLILLCAFLVKPELINPTMGNQVNIVESFLLLPQNIFPLLMVGWPLVNEIYFYIVFAFLLMTPEKHLMKLLFLWGVFVILGFTMLNHTNLLMKSAYLIIIFHPLTLEFVSGCIIALLIGRGTVKLGSVFFAAGVFFLFITGLIYYYNPSLLIYDIWIRIFLFGFPYSLMVYGAVAIEKKREKNISAESGNSMVSYIYKFLKKIGDQSYSIYLSHTLVINGIGWIWAYPMIMQKNNHMLWIVIMLVSSFITGYISFKFLETPMIKITKKYSQTLLKQGNINVT